MMFFLCQICYLKCVRICPHVCVCAHTCVHVCVCLCVCVCVCACACVCVCACAHVCMWYAALLQYHNISVFHTFLTAVAALQFTVQATVLCVSKAFMCDGWSNRHQTLPTVQQEVISSVIWQLCVGSVITDCMRLLLLKHHCVREYMLHIMNHWYLPLTFYAISHCVCILCGWLCVFHISVYVSVFLYRSITILITMDTTLLTSTVYVSV